MGCAELEYLSVAVTEREGIEPEVIEREVRRRQCSAPWHLNDLSVLYGMFLFRTCVMD